MSKKIEDIALELKNANKKAQLIYAFNGTGKTRLSRAFKELIASKNEDGDEAEPSRNKILYYNAFTEDLFYWDNDLESDLEPKLKIQPNSFTDWILRDRGQDQNIISTFQRYTDDKLTPSFIEADKIVQIDGKKRASKTYPEVTFSFDRGTETTGNVKISKGEESNFIWSIFYTLLEEVISILEEPVIENREDNQFDGLEYVFIDDPVSSLDDNHLIEIAIDIAKLVKRSTYANGKGIKFIIATHNPLFYNVLFNEFNNDLSIKLADGSRKKLYKRDQSKKYRLGRLEDGTYEIQNANDHPFSYHLFLLSELQKAIQSQQIEKYHFNFLRNILEKTATFLGRKSWPELLPKMDDGTPDPFFNRILNLSSHSAHAGDENAMVRPKDKEKLAELVNFLENNYGFWHAGEQNG